MKVIIGILIIIMILFAGCTSVCVPIHVKEKIMSNNGDLIVVDDNDIAYMVSYRSVYDDIAINETNYLSFSSGARSNIALVTGFCGSKVKNE